MIELGKIPPQNIEAEISVLGCCLVYPGSVHSLKLRPEMFYKEAHQKIYNAILEVSKRGGCDLVMVTEQLRKDNELDVVGGPVYLAKITETTYSNSNIEQYSFIVREKYLLREYIRIACEIAKIAFIEDVADVSEYAESELFKLTDFIQTKEPIKVSKCIDDLLADIEKIKNKEKTLIGVPSGFTSIDRKTGGWQPGNLIIIAGRPSMGKTALALTFTINTSKLGYPVCLFSLEMSENELAARYLSSVSDYSNVEIRNAEVDLEKISLKSNDIAMLPIIIDDTPALSLMDLRSKVKKVILRHGVKLVVIDYLQLMRAEAGNREQEVSTISRGLKAISKEFNIPVIALSQLNRDVENRADRRPRLADLRESGAIEQDADIVCFLYRPVIYGIQTIEIDKDTFDTKDMLLIDCAKDRNGALFSIPLYHNDYLTKIQENKFKEPF